ncbi:MAG: bifunctional tetrahydrofolate synthase/dihydrofolate synthase [Betaproteobacteria bacterium]|nr:bifunctional tetrahydrofolate synthase/dihydrofolate synthase [Betaproteobacteria bacterium]
MNLEPGTLQHWLEHIERQHPKTIALGLERVGRVGRALGLQPPFPLITIGGTNGKGSVCALLEAILHQAGYRVGCYTSPHLLRYNERVRIGRAEASDAELVRAFARVEEARADVPLTYFEFGTLAAVWLFIERKVEAGVLEVGLGGRLDAVNVFDADCAVITTVDIDHVDYLGAEREAIGYEKAGIFRAGRPAVCAAAPPPARLARHAAEIGAQLLVIGTDFGATAQGAQWQYWGPRGKRGALPHPALRGARQLANAAAAIAALDCLRERLPVAMNDIRSGLLQAENPGRFQVLPGRPAVILDVAHNPQAARALAESLSAMKSPGRTLAVFAMLKDKDIAGVVAALQAKVDRWFVSGLPGPRGAEAAGLQQIMAAAGVAAATPCADVAAAYAQACELATENDRILVFGSFYTVAAVMQLREARRLPKADAKT